MNFTPLDRMEYMQQGQPQGPHSPFVAPQSAPMSQYNPIQAGAEQGMMASRQSIEMDESQRRKASGMALLKMMNGINARRHGGGFQGLLGSINENFLPAMQSYRSEEELARDRNSAAIDHMESQQSKAAKSAFEREKHEFDKNYKERKLSQKKEGKGNSDMQTQKELRLLGKEEKEVVKLRNSMIRDRLKDTPAYTTKDKKIAKDLISLEVDQELAPVMKGIQERKSYHKKDTKSLGMKSYDKELNKEAAEVIQNRKSESEMSDEELMSAIKG